MRKAKLMLTILFLLTVISGSLAYSLIKKRQAGHFYAPNAFKGNACNLTVLLLYSIAPNCEMPGAFTSYISSLPTTTGCPLTCMVSVQ
ncbi:hypothetical protein ACDQ55_09450 [Chitinophaga sp. 30R24]|uniref:hypothetical protein n=1 Tax=Chitinophaga sp. 30R24 TaxID=3248838 RepID=UPI003B8F6588